MAQFEMTHCYDQAPAPWDYSMLRVPMISAKHIVSQSVQKKCFSTLNFMLLENAPCEECIDKGMCFLLKHRNIIATAYWMLLLKPSFVISQGQPCWYTFHAIMPATNKRPIKCVKPKLTPLYFHSLHARYAWLLYNTIQQFFLECIIIHEYNNDFAFPLYSSIYTAILNIQCFFFPLVYLYFAVSSIC